MMRFFWVFLLLPIIEIALFVVIGGEIGVWATIGWVILSAILGTALIRSQGRQAALDFQQSLQGLRAPTAGIGQRSLTMVAGFLLILPGFFTDALGALLLIPFVRDLVLRQIAARSGVATMNFGYTGQSTPFRDAGVIDGEYVIQDDPYVPSNEASLPGPDSTRKTSQNGKDSPWTRH